MSIKVRELTLNNPIVIAPMAGVTDLTFRSMIRQFQPGLIYTEMVSDKAIVHRNERTLEMMKIHPDEHPISLQLFGHDIDSMVEAARYMDQQTTCDIIDVNMGCPVTKVVKNGAGSALLKNPDYAHRLLAALVQAVNKPVSVKIRLGWDKSSVNAVEIAQAMEAAGVSLLAVHGRVRSQMYSGEVDLQAIKAVKEAVRIPVLGNGDITSVISAQKMFEETGCDGIMIGREVLKNPWLIEMLINQFSNHSPDINVSMDDKFNWLRLHCLTAISESGEEWGMKHMRSHALWMISGMPNGAELKRLISQMKSLEEFDRIVREYKERVII